MQWMECAVSGAQVRTARSTHLSSRPARTKSVPAPTSDPEISPKLPRVRSPESAVRSCRTKYYDQLVVKAQNSCQSLTWLPITGRKLTQEALTCKPALRSKPQNWNCCKFTTKRQFTTKTKRLLLPFNMMILTK